MAKIGAYMTSKNQIEITYHQLVKKKILKKLARYYIVTTVKQN